MNPNRNIYLAGIRKTNLLPGMGGDQVPQIVKGMISPCVVCWEPIVPEHNDYYIGEIIKCDNCKTMFSVQEKYGFMNLVKGDLVVARAKCLLRYFEQKVRYRIKLGGSQVLYFSNEYLAESYSQTLKHCGQSTSWYGERLNSGRAYEMDIIYDDIELFAVLI